MSNRKPTSVSRLQKDYLRLKKDPVPYITAEPLPQNILEWHFVVKGPEGSPYQGGYYHGTLHFPIDFPFKPPSIYMITPNGRFKTNTRLCLSISGEYRYYNSKTKHLLVCPFPFRDPQTVPGRMSIEVFLATGYRDGP